MYYFMKFMYEIWGMGDDLSRFEIKIPMLEGKYKAFKY